MGLTRAGWPRPLDGPGGLPVPWISPSDSLGQFDERRHAAAASGAVCGVCGLAFDPATLVYLLYQGARQLQADGTATRDGIESRITAIDNTFMHGHCATLALKMCPKLRELREAGNLHCARLYWERVRTPYVKRSTGLLQGYALAEDCEPIDLEDFRHA